MRVSLDLQTDTGMKLLEKMTFDGKFIPDIINRRVLGQAAYSIKQANTFYKKLSDRPVYKRLRGQALGFKKMMFSQQRGLGGYEGMMYGVAAKKDRASIYVVLEEPYTREEAIAVKKPLMRAIVNAAKTDMSRASEKAIDDTFKMLGWK